jgi:hypothetical protein
MSAPQLSYSEWQWGAEIVREVSLLHRDRLHVRVGESGQLLCGQSPRAVEYVDPLPTKRVDLPADLHGDCRARVPM